MLSVALIVFSYLSNQWLAGMVVLITHDSSDALLLLARFYKEYKNSYTPIVVVLGFFGSMSWLVMRGILYPIYLVGPVFYRFVILIADSQNEVYELIYWPGAYIALMVVTLQIMDYIWI